MARAKAVRGIGRIRGAPGIGLSVAIPVYHVVRTAMLAARRWCEKPKWPWWVGWLSGGCETLTLLGLQG